MVRGTDTSKTPKLHSLTLVYRKKLDLREGFQFEVDLNDSYDGKSPYEMRSALRQAIESNKKVRFTYRADDQNSDEIRDYYVDVISATNLEHTGRNERGTSRVSVAEV